MPDRPSDPYDVLVVGARCGGAATALLLARAGLRVLVLDQARRGSDTLSTHALMRGGAQLLHRWGLLERLAATGAPAVRHVRFDYGDEVVNVSLKPSHGVDALYAPRRAVFDAMLVEAAEAAGARVRFGVRVTGLSRDRTGRVTGVTAREAAGAARAYAARLVVGADGAGSLVARQAGARWQRVGGGASGMVYGYWSGLPVDGYEWYYRPGVSGSGVSGSGVSGSGVSAGLIPTHHGQVCVFAGTTVARFAAEVHGDLAAGYHRLLKEATGGAGGRLGVAVAPDRLYGFPGRPSHLRQAWGPGWALVGDAGFFLDPLSTHGITDALRDAHLLTAAVLDWYRGGGPGRPAAEAEALTEYHRGRDRLATALFPTVDQIAGYRWNLPELRRLLRESASAMSAEVAAISQLKVDG